SHNTSVHSSTGFTPAYLLRGFHPNTGASILPEQKAVPRPSNDLTETGGEIQSKVNLNHKTAEEMIEQFLAEKEMAKEALVLSQIFQRKAYNKGKLKDEFEEGELIVLNPHSLNLLRNKKGRGKKLLMKYDGPFEILQKISPVTYRIRMPASYGMHPVLNIAHLERYHKSPDEFGNRPSKKMNRDDFENLPEFAVDRIVSEKIRKQGRRKIRLFKVRFKDFGPESDEWLTARQLKN